jgi:hypothetical protein
MAPDFTVRLTRLEVMTAEQLTALEALVRLCRKDGVEGEIAYRPPATTGPSHWWETTLVYMAETMLDTAGEPRVQEVADIIARRASQWASARLERGETARPHRPAGAQGPGRGRRRARGGRAHRPVRRTPNHRSDGLEPVV